MLCFLRLNCKICVLTGKKYFSTAVKACVLKLCDDPSKRSTFFTCLGLFRLLLKTAEPQNIEPQNFEGMYSGNFIKNRAKRFHTSTFDIHVIDIRYSQFSTDYFANNVNLQYNLFVSGLSYLRSLFQNVLVWSRSRRAKILTTGIHLVF